jgi:hypothetical protein
VLPPQGWPFTGFVTVVASTLLLGVGDPSVDAAFVALVIRRGQRCVEGCDNFVGLLHHVDQVHPRFFKPGEVFVDEFRFRLHSRFFQLTPSTQPLL